MAKAHKPTKTTRAEVKALASYGVRQQEIAKYIGITRLTLTRHYRKELDTSMVQANTKVAKFLLHAASGDALEDPELKATFTDCLRAAMFWAKTRMDFSERIPVTGADGGPIEVEVTHKVVDPKK